MPDIRTDRLPAASSLWTLFRDGDFIDCYSVESSLTPSEAARRGLSLPVWARALLALRNRLVRPFGLKTGEAGPKDAIFPVQRDTPDELVLGTDDRHLDFRIAVFRLAGRLYLSTWVHPHNVWGRIYLRLVLPAHVLISRGAARRMAA